jgi:hypothetical protein
MVMLPGSLCPSSSMSYLYDIWKEDFYIIAVDYNGYDENSTFSKCFWTEHHVSNFQKHTRRLCRI